ncbi:hypothetical protein SLA2020_513330 [Shorea laevis]
MSVTVNARAQELQSRRRVRSAALERTLSAVSMGLPIGAVVPMPCAPVPELPNYDFVRLATAAAFFTWSGAALGSYILFGWSCLVSLCCAVFSDY